MRDRLRVVDRSLKDATVTAISDDLRFQTAYEAALQLATIVLAAAGYRSTAQRGHHWVAFEAFAEILGPDHREVADYLQQAKDKRHRSHYDAVGEIAESEVEELVVEVRKLKSTVLGWLRQRYPRLAP